MPMYEDDPVWQGPRIGVHPSVAIEMDWVLSGAHRPERSGNDVIEELYRQRPDLADEVRALWGPDEATSYAGYLELSILAHHGGLLFSTDAASLIAGLEALCADAPVDLVLGSETPDDRIRLLRRLAVLRRSAARRRRYVDVVARVWAEVAPVWEANGLPQVEATVAERRRVLDRTHPRWEDYVRTDCGNAPMDDLMAHLGPDGELAVVPAWFTRRGLTVDLPGLVVVGVRTDSAALASRARAEGLSRRLKAISDPTRLAILDTLAREPMTVTDLAARFSVSQPTISNHVKILRHAGVVGSGPDRRLVIHGPAMEEIIGELQILTGAGPAVAPVPGR